MRPERKYTGQTQITLPAFLSSLRIIFLMIFFIILFSSSLVVLGGEHEKSFPNLAYDNKDDYGQSLLKKHLMMNYTVTSNKISLNSLAYDPDSVVLIINPTIIYSTNEIQQLIKLVNQGQKIIILGSNANTRTLLHYFQLDISEEEYYDYRKNPEQPYYVKSNTSRNTIVFFKPRTIIGTTKDYTPMYWMSETATNDPSNKTIFINNPLPVIGKVNAKNIVFGGDGWFLSNFMINRFPNNLKAIDTLIQSLGNTSKIILEESAYAWYPSSRISAMNFLYTFYVRKQSILFTIIWIVFPVLVLLIVSYSLPFKRKTRLETRVSKRLKDLYINKYDVYPLTMEERFLMNYKNLQGMHRAYFLKFVAKELREEMIKRGFYEYLPDIMKENLDITAQLHIREGKAWQVIENIIIAFKLFQEFPPEAVKKELEKSLSNRYSK